MKPFITHAAVFSVVLLSACGGGKKQETLTITDKKTQLKKLKKDEAAISDQIKKLETEIGAQDPAAADQGAAKLVSVTPLAPQGFVHFIDLQGKVDADNISYVSPRLGPGQVKALYVKKGDHVRKGQLLL